MAKKHRDPAAEAASGDSPAAAIRSLFSADNPFRRKASTEEPAATPAPAPAATLLRKQPSPGAEAADPSSKKKKSKEEGPRPKRKRDELEAGRERRRGAGTEKPPRVGEKRKAPDDAAAGAEEDEEEFDDESKLLRTVFVGNLPLRTQRKVLTKEFAAFGEIESVRIRSVPLVDVSTVPFPSPSSLFGLGWKGFSFVWCRASCRPSFRGEGPFYRGRSMNWSISECSFASGSLLFFI